MVGRRQALDQEAARGNHLSNWSFRMKKRNAINAMHRSLNLIRISNPKSPGYDRALKDCQGCHKDEHRGQFVKKISPMYPLSYARGLETE